MSKKIKLSREYVLKVIANEAVAIPVGQKVVDGKCVMDLSMDAYELLRKVEQGKTYAQIIDETMKEHGFQQEIKEQFERDVDGFFEQMIQEGILEDGEV